MKHDIQLVQKQIRSLGKFLQENNPEGKDLYSLIAEYAPAWGAMLLEAEPDAITGCRYSSFKEPSKVQTTLFSHLNKGPMSTLQAVVESPKLYSKILGNHQILKQLQKEAEFSPMEHSKVAKVKAEAAYRNKSMYARLQEEDPARLQKIQRNKPELYQTMMREHREWQRSKG